MPSRSTPTLALSTGAPSSSAGDDLDPGSPPTSPRTPRRHRRAPRPAVLDHLHVGRGLVGAHRGKRQGQACACGRARSCRARTGPGAGPAAVDGEVDQHAAAAGLRARVDAHHPRRAPAPAMPSTCSRAARPIASAATSSGASVASSSSCDRSTISISRASIATRSPGCASRCDTRPEIGAQHGVVVAALRASVDRRQRGLVAWRAAPASFEIEVSRPVAEMKPWSTSALLFSSARVAMSICDLVDAAVCSAWRSFSSSSVVSSWPRTWPARTLSPSRTVSDLQLAGDPRPDDGAVDRLQPARDLERARQVDGPAPPGRRPARDRARPEPAPTPSAPPASPCLRDQRAGDEAAERDDDDDRDRQPCQRFIGVRRRWTCAAPSPSRSPAGQGAGARLQAVQDQVDLGFDHRLRVELLADDAGAERVLVHHQEEQRRHQGMDGVLDIADRSELAAVDAALHDLGDHPVGRGGDLVDAELGDLREVAHLGHHQLEDARGAGLADPLPPEAQHVGEQLGRDCPRRRGRSPCPRRSGSPRCGGSLP